jgi:ribulose-bisphosphate carboxylase large chain
MQKEYVDLKLKNLTGGAYLLAVFHIVPAKGLDLLDVASEVAAESSTGSNVKVVDTKFAAGLNALVYKVDKKKNLVWIAYPWRIFDRGGNVQNILTYIAGNVFGMSNLKALKLLDVWFPKAMLKNYDGPGVSLPDMRKYLGVHKRPILGTIVKPKIGLKPSEFAHKAYLFWSGGGDFVKHDEPQADQDFCPFNKTVDAIRKAMDKAEKETGHKKIHSFNISSPDFMTMKKRAEYIIKKMKKGSYCFLVDGITAGWSAVQTARRLWPNVIIHFHRAGHGAMTRVEAPFGYTAVVLSKFARLAGASAVHTGTAGIGKMAGDVNDDIQAAYAAYLPKSKTEFFTQDWYGMKGCVSIASGGLNPTKLKPYIEAIGHVDFITTMGGGVHGHPAGTKAGATALVQACDAWRKKISIKEYAKKHEELAQAIERYTKK